MESASRPAPAEPEDEVGLLRRTVVLEAVPAEAPARIWVDGRFLLLVNGHEVARGPVRSDPRRAHYDVVDLAPQLVVGENVIAVVARRYEAATSWWTPVPATYSLGAGCMAFEALIDGAWIVSDASWRSQTGEAWTPVPLSNDVASLPIEWFDARRHPFGWDSPGFDDHAWRAAREIVPLHTGASGDPTPSSEPFGMLLPPVRAAMPSGDRHDAAAISTVAIEDVGVLVDPVDQVLRDEVQPVSSEGSVKIHRFDLGRIAAGTVCLEVRDAPSGTRIDVAASEHIDSSGALVTLGQHAGFRFVCTGGDPESFETFDLVGARYLTASVRAEGAEVSLSLSITDRHRPRPSGASFDCSDALLTTIHQVGLRTVDLCALDAYVDCPTREQRAWTGDSVVHQMVDLVSNPDWSMARWHPELAAAPRADGMLAMAPASDFWADDATMVPDWSLHWVRSVHNLYRWTGDRELVGRLLPVVERTLRWFDAYVGEDGLLSDVTGWVLTDWASVYSTGCSSTLNALWARALEDLAEMARWFGNEGTARWADDRRDQVIRSFGVFYDESRGVYVDHLLDGAPQRPAAQHGGAAALAAGLVPGDRIDRVVAGLTDRSRLIRHSWVMTSATVEGGGMDVVPLISGPPAPDWDVERQMVEAEPFFRYVLHDGLARAGRADLIADLCRDWSVFLDAGETTWPECWVGGTRCHGWSSTPTRDLIVHVLGIQPAEPGWGSARIAPALGGLEWAKASVPTPHGWLHVEARADGTLEVDSPVPWVGPAPT